MGKQKKLDESKLLSRKAPAMESAAQPAPTPSSSASREAFVTSSSRRGVGRPRSSVSRKQVTIYLRDENKEVLEIGSVIEKRPASDIVEELVEHYYKQNKADIDRARAALNPGKPR